MSGRRAATTRSRTCRRPRWSPDGAGASSCCPSSRAAPAPDCSRRPPPVRSDLGTVIVTGGASGLGAAVAAAVAGAGGTPVVLDRREPDNGVLREVVALASPADARAAGARVIEEDRDVRGVATAAGVHEPPPLAETAWEEMEGTG